MRESLNNNKMTDDDLRFGDVDSESKDTGETDIANLVRQVIIGLVGIYVVLKIVEILFNIPVPFI